MISNDLENINSLPEILFRNTKNFPSKEFLFKKNKKGWTGKNFKEISKNVLILAQSFLKKGIKKNDRVLLISSNRIEWIEIDFAIMTIGAITVPSYVTNNVRDNIYIVRNCDPQLIIFENYTILIHLPSNNQLPLLFQMYCILSQISFLEYKRDVFYISQQGNKIYFCPIYISLLIF